MQITIDVAMLKAVSLAQAVLDIRYYLNGVLVEVTNGKSLLVATDGHRMHVGKNTDCPGIADMQIIIPTNAIKDALKIEKSATVTLTVTDSNPRGYQLGVVPFSAVEGVFPQWRRVVPAITECAILPPVNGNYVGDIARAAKILGDKFGGMFIHADSEGSMLAKPTSRTDFFAVVMAMRQTDKIKKTPDAPWHTADKSSKPDWV